MRLNHFALALIAICLIAGLLVFRVFRCGQKIDLDITVSPLAKGQNSVIFAAYSQDGVISDYVVSYLRKLKEIAPNIVYVTDNSLPRCEIAKLIPYVNHIIAGRHGEYDWGSYKRGFNLLLKSDALNTVPLLIFANDSTLPVASSFKPILEKFQLPLPSVTPTHASGGNGQTKETLSAAKPEFYGITANTDGMFHLQSYFLIFTPPVFLSPDFAAYLNSVKQEKDGLTVAAKYEVPFTKYLEDRGFQPRTYLPYEKMNHLPLNDKNCYPLTLLSQYGAPFLKMRTFTSRLNVQESRRLLFNWLKKNAPEEYTELIAHLKKIKSGYLYEARK